MFRGKDLLKKIKHVKELKTVGIFSSFIRLSKNIFDNVPAIVLLCKYILVFIDSENMQSISAEEMNTDDNLKLA